MVQMESILTHLLHGKLICHKNKVFIKYYIRTWGWDSHQHMFVFVSLLIIPHYAFKFLVIKQHFNGSSLPKIHTPNAQTHTELHRCLRRDKAKRLGALHVLFMHL